MVASCHHSFLHQFLSYRAIERGQLFRKLHPRGQIYFDEEGDPTKYWFQPPYLEKSRAASRLARAVDYLELNRELEFGVSWADKLKELEL